MNQKDKLPEIILIQPQLPVNIGAVARAMGNFGYLDSAHLRLVAPQCNHLDDDAIAMAAGAESILSNAKVYDDFEAAIADLNTVYATSGEDREMVKPYITPKQAATEFHAKQGKLGFAFGCERIGMTNDQLGRCNKIIHIPTASDFSSLNLAQAVIVIMYEYYQTLSTGAEAQPDVPFATQQQVSGFLGILEEHLDATKYWRVDAKKPNMRRNLFNIFTRVDLTQQEVQTLIGMVKSLSRQMPEGD